MRVILLILSLCFFITLHFVLASQLYISSDVSYLLNVTQQFLHGEKYGVQIFETNPPLILYLYTPPVLFANITGFSVLSSMTGYTLILTLLSLFISIILLQKMIRHHDNLIIFVIVNALYFVYFIFPVSEWGQREYFLMIFSFPYILLTTLYLENKSTSIFLSIFVGFFAALGFGLKPFFLVPLIFMECYIMIVKRSLFGWVRPVSLVLLFTLLVYFFSVIIFSPTYFTIMIPLIKHFYFVGFTQPLIFMLQTKTMLYVLLGLISYFLFKSIDPYKMFSTLLCLFIFGMYLAVFMTRTAWFYHTMPAVSYTFVLLCYFATVFFFKFLFPRWISFSALFFVLILISFPLLQFAADRYAVFNKRQHSMTQVFHFVQQLPPSERRAIACLSIATNGDCFPLVQLVGAQYVHGFPFIWWLFGALRYEGISQSATLSRALQKEKIFLINKIADELNVYQPQLIIMNVKAVKFYILPQFNLIHYLSQNRNFQCAFGHYYYKTTIKNHGQVIYVIYERKR